MFIQYDGTNGEEIRRSISALKPDSEITVAESDGGVSFGQVFPGGQHVPARWFIRPGQHLNAATGAVVDEP